MKALILAAGRGTRLAATGHTLPKGFLRLGNQTLIEESLARLRSVGIEDIVIATGYQAECYEAVNGVRCVHNPIFAESGSLHSLACALPALGDSPFVLLESDLVYETRALSTVLENPADNVVLLSGTTGAGDEVWVECDESGQLRAMSKNRSQLSRVDGEFVGVCKISAALGQRLLEQARRNPLQDYETDGLVEAAASTSIQCPRVDDLVWSEIDDESHLLRARAQVYPRLAAP